MQIETLRKDIKKLRDPVRAKVMQGFFKTGKGEYGEDDIFVGLTVPQTRSLAKKYSELSYSGIRTLLKSCIHEERLLALLILVHNFEAGDIKDRKEIFDFYFKNIRRANNWDLVDLSADKIVGAHLFGKSNKVLDKLAHSGNLWERRISIIATFYYIKQGKFNDTLRISEILLHDKHDLIHKAVGWMLREVGKRSQKTEEEFLKKHYKSMPRTALRYAIERFPERKQKQYLKR
jgi:3-methyladenine DNA glycosylase AlkD